MIELRPYQGACIDAILNALTSEETALVQAPTGAGKTMVMCFLIHRYVSRYPSMRVLVLAHMTQLVGQFADAFERAFPEYAQEVRIVCESARKAKNIGKQDVATGRVVIGTRQSVVSQMESIGEFNLVIIDEAHRLPKVDPEYPSQYEQILGRLKERHPTLRLLGVTATPFRTDGGLIYGQSKGVWFPRLTFKVTMKDLMEEGYLCGLRAMAAENPDLSGIRKRGGEFVEGELGEEMVKKVHLESAVKALRDYGSGRKHVVVFAVTVAHAELLRDVFIEAGETAVAVHSKMGRQEREDSMVDFETGAARVIVNVGCLTEGWDCPQADCILMCRPTASLALWIQMVGRGVRTAHGKTDCLLLDLAGNWARLGDPTDPRLKENLAAGKRKKKDGEEEEDTTPGRMCPHCFDFVPATAFVCPTCGETLQLVENRRLKLSDVSCTRNKTWDETFGIRDVDVVGCIPPAFFVTRKGETCMRLDVQVLDQGKRHALPVFFSFDSPKAGEWWKLKIARRTWDMFGGHRPYPQSVREAVERGGELAIPPKLKMGRKLSGYYALRER